jgi:alpha-glucosidase (family GH31 glycosyl hydrolase)
MNRTALHNLLVVTLVAVGCSKPESNSNSNVDVGNDAAVPDTGKDASDAQDTGNDSGADADAGSACTYQPDQLDEIPASEGAYTPRWAFRPWISKDISDTGDTDDFVDGFIDRDIPVGTVVLDSPWETNYNTFVPNPDRYPNFEQLVSDMRDRDVRVVLWITQFVNEGSFDAERGGDSYPSPSPNFPEGELCGFFVDDAKRYTWWKGRGAGVDFFDPVAVQWWHDQQDPLLEMGIAGWKLDFGDSYLTSDPVLTDAGEVPHQQYSEAYYRDFHDYGVHRVGQEDFVTMVRGYDESYQFEGRFFARPEHAPVVWAGDNRRDWVGLADALDHMFRSAEAGYVVVGSDLGGYLDRDDQDLGTSIPFSRDNFLRWLAMAAMTPFMQLHGRANLTPWSLPDDPDPDESVAFYRYWAHLHTELIPFWYSLAEEAYAGNEASIMRPIGDEADWPGDYRYTLGDAFLVAPILDETGIRDVELPEGTWYDWWSEVTFEGPTTESFDYSGDLQKIPLLVKEGAIVPVVSTSDVSEITGGGLSDALVVLGWPSTTATDFVMHDEDDQTTTLELEDRGADVVFRTSRATRPVVVRLRFEETPAGVTVDGTEAVEVTTEAELLGGDTYRADGTYLWVSVAATDQPVEVVVTR